MPVSIIVKNDGVGKWMDRALKRAQKLCETWQASDVHELRVALRRCRTMADALIATNPSPGWNKLKKNSKKVFHSLGELRDVQVEEQWVKQLFPQESEARTQLLKQLKEIEKNRLKEVQKQLTSFNRKEWRKLIRRLRGKADMFPLGSVVFQRLALTQLNEALVLYQQARKRKSGIAWHRTRIAIKRFRYIVENFLPQQYEVWAKDLKEMQDLLGEVHDLDVLRTFIRRHSRQPEREKAAAEWIEKIETARAERLEKFLSKTNGKQSFWFDWRSGLQGGTRLLPILTDEGRAVYSAS